MRLWPLKVCSLGLARATGHWGLGRGPETAVGASGRGWAPQRPPLSRSPCPAGDLPVGLPTPPGRRQWPLLCGAAEPSEVRSLPSFLWAPGGGRGGAPAVPGVGGTLPWGLWPCVWYEVSPEHSGWGLPSRGGGSSLGALGTPRSLLFPAPQPQPVSAAGLVSVSHIYASQGEWHPVQSGRPDRGRESLPPGFWGRTVFTPDSPPSSRGPPVGGTRAVAWLNQDCGQRTLPFRPRVHVLLTENSASTRSGRTVSGAHVPSAVTSPLFLWARPRGSLGLPEAGTCPALPSCVLVAPLTSTHHVLSW